MIHSSGSAFPKFSRLILLALAGWLIFNLVQTVGYIAADYSPIPIGDYWRVPLHSEHRIGLPELIYMADTFFLHGRMYLPIALSGLCYIGVWFVLIWAAYSQQAMESPVREIALLLAGIVIAWKGCSSAIAMPFQLQFTMLQFAAATILAILGRKSAKGTQSCRRTDEESVETGGLSVPVLREFLKRHLVVAIAAVVFVAASFLQHRFLLTQHPIQSLKALCSYAGMPFGSPSTGMLIGAINLLLMGSLFAFAWQRGLLKSRLGVVLFGSYLFDLIGFQFAQATMPIMNWALLTIALLWLVGQAKSQNWSFVAASLFAAFFAYGFLKAAPWFERLARIFKTRKSLPQCWKTMSFNRIKLDVSSPIRSLCARFQKRLKTITKPSGPTAKISGLVRMSHGCCLHRRRLWVRSRTSIRYRVAWN